MNKNKGLNNQWQDDEHSDASSYVSDQNATYRSQASPNNRPSGNRTKPDYADQSQPDAYKAYVKPVQPDYGMQFEEITGDITVKRDRWFNEIPVDKTNHSVPAEDSGRPGSRQYAEFQSSDNDGYGVVIEHDQSAAFNTPSTYYADVSRADRGAEFVESNNDSGQTGPSRPYSDSNSVAQGNTPPIISYLNSIRGRK